MSRFSSPNPVQLRIGVLLIVLAISACDGGPSTPEPPTVALVSVSPSQATIPVGGRTTLVATVRDADGNVLTDRAVTWTSEGSGVAAVEPGGVVEGVGAGTATIRAESEGVAGTATITVVAPAALACGEAATGSIDAAGQSRLYEFSGGSGDRVALVLIETGGFQGGPAPRARVTSAEGTDLATFDANARRDLVLPATDGYFAWVTASDGTATGSFSIALECFDPGATGSVPLDRGDVAPGDIDIAGEADVYTFSADAGDRVTVLLAETSGFGGPAEAAATVLSPTGEPVDSVRAPGQLELTLSESGTHFIRVGASDLVAVGSYVVGLDGLNPVTPSAVAMTLGSLEADTLDGPGEVRILTFDGEIGNRISLALVETAGFELSAAPLVTLFAPSGAQLDRFEGDRLRDLNLPETGTYVLRVNANDLVATGEYAVGLEGLNPVTPGPVLELGALLSSTLDEHGAVDLFPFSGQSGDRVSLALVETQGFPGISFAEASVLSPAGTRILRLTANGRADFALPDDGAYVIRVTANDLFSRGSYVLGLEGLSPPTPTAPAIGLGDLRVDSVASAAETDLFTFTGNADQRVSLVLLQTGGFTVSSLAAALLSPDGTELLSLTPGRLEDVTLPDDGTYVLRLESSDLLDTGSYVVGLEGVSPASSDAVSLALGDVAARSFVDPGQVDLFTLDGQIGDRISLLVAATSPFGQQGAPRIAIFSPSGSAVETLLASVLRTIVLEESGTYVIRVNPANLTTLGTYVVGVEGLGPVSPDAVPLTLGALAADSLDEPGRADLYTFPGQSGDRVSIAVVETADFPGNASPAVTVWGPSGDSLATLSNPQGDRVDLTLPESGTYVMRLNASNLVATGAYALGLEGIDPPTPGTAGLSLGSLVGGTLDAAAETDLFTLTAQSGELLSLTVVETFGFGGGDRPTLTVLSPAGAALASFGANGQQLVQVGESGTHVLWIAGAPLTATGSYAVGVEGISPLTPGTRILMAGDSVTDSLMVAGQVDLYAFSGQANTQVTITLVETSGFAGSPRPVGAVISPAGVIIDTVDPTSTGPLDVTLPVSGTYVIRVSANTLVATGSYSVKLEN